MKQLQSLIELDYFRIHNWFRYHLITKTLVVFAFAIIVSLIVAAEYFLANIFFRYTSLQQEFGLAVAEYSINAAILVLFLLAVVSSIASSHASLYKPTFLRFLHSTPVTLVKIYLSRLIAALFSYSIMLVVFLAPLLIAFGNSFPVGNQYLLRSTVSLLFLALISHSLGSILVVVMVSRFGKISQKMLILMYIAVISLSLILMRFLFPPNFFKLYYAQDWQSFSKQLGQLPLLSNYLPSKWIASTITGNWSLASLKAFITTAVVLITSVWIGKNKYRRSWMIAQEGNLIAGKNHMARASRSNFPKLSHNPISSLITNEFLAILRSSGETWYLAFLMSLIMIIFFLMRNIPALSATKPDFVPAVATLSLIGFLYLFTTLSARFIYPLVAKEKKTSWLIFSVPLKKEYILNAKIVFSFLLSLIMLLVGLIAGGLAQMNLNLNLYYALLLFIVSFNISLIQLFIGAIAPNFVESENLDATSTSGSGLLAITASIFITLLTAVLFYLSFIGRIGYFSSLRRALIIMILVSFPLYLSARKKIYFYDI